MSFTFVMNIEPDNLLPDEILKTLDKIKAGLSTFAIGVLDVPRYQSIYEKDRLTLETQSQAIVTSVFERCEEALKTLLTQETLYKLEEIPHDVLDQYQTNWFKLHNQLEKLMEQHNLGHQIVRESLLLPSYTNLQKVMDQEKIIKTTIKKVETVLAYRLCTSPVDFVDVITNSLNILKELVINLNQQLTQLYELYGLAEDALKKVGDELHNLPVYKQWEIAMKNYMDMKNSAYSQMDKQFELLHSLQMQVAEAREELRVRVSPSLLQAHKNYTNMENQYEKLKELCKDLEETLCFLQTL